MIASRIPSLAEVAEVARQDGRLTCALRDFLDGFYAAPSPEKIRDEPAKLALTLRDDGLATPTLPLCAITYAVSIGSRNRAGSSTPTASSIHRISLRRHTACA